MNSNIVAGLIGALGGAVVTFAVWKIASSQLDREFDRAAAQILERGEAQLRQEIVRTLDAEIPRRVDAEMAQQFRNMNMTPETGRQLANALALAERVHLIGVR